jgi:protease I
LDGNSPNTNREQKQSAVDCLGDYIMATILMPLPSQGFDPSETGIPWRVLGDLGHRIVFATPDGQPGVADRLMVTGQGLGLLASVLKADQNGLAAHEAMVASSEFCSPLRYEAIAGLSFDALLLPGGHAKEMKPYLESPLLQRVVAECFALDKPVGAICHGVVLAARSKAPSGKSVLHGRKTTALLRRQELIAWNLTRLYLGDYYRTYPVTVEDEVRAALAQPDDFRPGPLSILRDTPERPNGFAVIDRNYVSARWPGDAYGFSRVLAGLL